jgi:hypothetical protein
MKQPKPILWDVCYIRLFLIIALIAHHAFCPYSFEGDAWPAFEGQTPNAVYLFFRNLFHSVLLEPFVFISGLIVGYKCQREEAQSTPGRLQALSFRALIVKRAQRLLIPSIIFSALFLFTLSNYAKNSIARNIYLIIEGYGHLWFLPMLFWCFVLLYLLERIHISPLIKFLFLLLFFSPLRLCIPGESLHFRNAAYYMVYFYAGYCVHRYHLQVSRWARPRYIIGTFLLFALVFLVNYDVHYSAIVFNLPDRLQSCVFILSRGIYSILGVIFLYLLAFRYVQNKNTEAENSTVLTLSSYCFGIYICQQFILFVLYYHTPLPRLVPSDFVPWLGFAITLLCSLLITHVALKSRVGRFLLG